MRKIVAFILLFASLGISAQNSQKIKNLEEDRKKALAQIEATNQLLSENKKTTSNALNRLSLLTQQIVTRRDIIRILNSEVEAADDGIKAMELNIRTLERELGSKKEAYALSLRKMYTNQNNQNKLLFIFSADNFAQSYRRILYLKEYAKWERRQADDILQKQKQVNLEKEKLVQSKEEKLLLLGNKKEEENKLQGEEDSQKKEVQSLKVQQKQLVQELNKQKKQAQMLNQAIEKAIADEIARAEREARAAAEAKRLAEKNREKEKSKERTKEKTKDKTEMPPVIEEPVEDTRVAETKGGYAMTKEERTLSGNFVNNRGLLPYPLKGNYKIVSSFGQHQHQDLKYVVTSNSGIDIQTTPGNKACSVFNGVVSSVFSIPGFNTQNIIVRHGNYLSVYCNIAGTNVKPGDKVSTGQALGTIFTNPEDGNSTILHFEIRKEKEKLNPLSWLK